MTKRMTKQEIINRLDNLRDDVWELEKLQDTNWLEFAKPFGMDFPAPLYGEVEKLFNAMIPDKELARKCMVLAAIYKESFELTATANAYSLAISMLKGDPDL